jgi:hypothetical protein
VTTRHPCRRLSSAGSSAAPRPVAPQGERVRRVGFVVVLEPLPDRLGRDPVIRLRLFLKNALRSYSLRAASVAEAPSSENQTPVIPAARKATEGREGPSFVEPQPRGT